ncbi:hypothetical protein DYB30_003942 [Aphanomyces astaci]|uniref:Alpha-type protein kinase domain-containing protein n=1 Tax=Aphanomyces astaci TaxID=112090 RepID=A0A397CQ58_APHAT|nr:hypothetical protein DYB30_003942 [Aphanomyces astaci]
MSSHRCTPTSEAEAKQRNALGAMASDAELADLLRPTSIKSNDVDTSIQIIRGHRKAAVDLTIHSVRETRDVYLAFLMDTTGSMASHLVAVKMQISAIVASISNFCQAAVHVAFVGYKDHCDGNDHIDVLPFTTDVAYFERFVRAVPAKGGGDVPEDVLGGLLAAVTQLTWPHNSTNVLFHIGDAPPHGRQFYGGRDSFPDGHENDKPLSVLFGLLHALDIQYNFGHMTGCTTEMETLFQSMCHECAVPMAVFNVADHVNIAPSVVSGVTMSSRSSSVSSTKSGRNNVVDVAPPPPVPQYQRRNISFSPHVPDWSTLEVLKGTVVSYMPPVDVDAIVAGTLDTLVRPIKLRVAPQPFAFGSERMVYYAQEYHKHSRISSVLSSKSTSSCASWTDVADEFEMTSGDAAFDYQVEAMVAKSFVYGGEASAMLGGKPEGCRYMKAMECQTAASFLARQFNHEAKPRHKICFLHAKVVRVPTTIADSYVYYGWEKHFESATSGTIPPLLKLTNNLGYVCDDESMADVVAVAAAFSHWTWHVTKGKLMVVDLQGQRTSKGLVLTDPAVHCVDLERFNSGTNLGVRGMDAFFQSHQCNSICNALQVSMP